MVCWCDLEPLKSCKLHSWRCWKNAQNVTYFALWGFRGALQPHAIHFSKDPDELMLGSNCHATSRLTVFDIFTVKWTKFRPKIWDFWDPLEVPPPKTKKKTPIPICTIMQNFPPIGVTVADISVSCRTKSLVSDETHTSVAFVGKNSNQYPSIFPFWATL